VPHASSVTIIGWVRQVEADKPANGLAIVDRVLDAFVRQAKALLRDVHAQHPLQTDWRLPALVLSG